MNNDELLSIKEVAEILNISTEEVGRLIDNGTIKIAEKFDGKRRVWRNDIPILNQPKEPTLDLPQAARYVGESEETLKALFKSGEITGKKKNGVYALSFKSLYKYLHFTKLLKP